MFASLLEYQTDIGRRINPGYLADEEALVRELARDARCAEDARAGIEAFAESLVERVRGARSTSTGLDSFLTQYDLSSAEGVALMCLAESLLRVPDADTADLLIADRLAAGDWQRHLGDSESMFVNASTWGLMLTGRLIGPASDAEKDASGFVHRLIARLGEPIVRAAFVQAMQIMGQQFIMGRDIDDVLKRASGSPQVEERYSFDMLGEAAMTADDAHVFHEAYLHAIERVGARNDPDAAVMAGSGVSVKLSALSPRLEFAQFARARDEVAARLLELACAARSANVPLTVDAEESDRLELTLAIFEAVFTDARIADWSGLGLAVQAYQRRATAVVEWLQDLAGRGGRTIPVRLVKGAYWDTEIKRAQENGWPSYPVFTRKANTDIAYMACVRRLGAPGSRLWPQFATHNAHTIAYVMKTVPEGFDFEFQRLHGMGEPLFDAVARASDRRVPCRVYAPVGRHEDLLPYLVRRLLENGANTSFVNRIVDESVPAAELVRQPGLRTGEPIVNPRIPQPPALFGETRLNSAGFNFSDGAALAALSREMQAAIAGPRVAVPIVSGQVREGAASPVVSPADRRLRIGRVRFATDEDVDAAVDAAVAAFRSWDAAGVAERAQALRNGADLLEAHGAELLALCVAEAGKCIPDAFADLREAVDFLRYYAAEGVRLMSEPTVLPGPTGERNELKLAGRGVFVCISPWNFPVAIFTGQVAAALVAGNTVIAKPAEQTSLVAARVIELLHEGGVPVGALQFVPGEGSTAGARAVSNPAIAGVVFTGSTDTAVAINRALAGRDGPLGTLIAETGGQNAMVVDSTALAEQVVNDVVASAFNSAGQRCSALRVLFLQDEIADRVVELLRGRMAEIRIGDPARLDTDVGPVIDASALRTLRAHRDRIITAGSLIFECSLSDGLDDGHFFAPVAVEVDDIALLEREVFGPILHVVRYAAADMDEILGDIERMGYGLTFGVQSRIERRSDAVAARIGVGNVYVNRNMIGAVVGVQ
ncbi:MAG: bifunctional proline dehydrogenase/L-glutamate gamma-semialdehyde dehydrogenase PutA, partial [Gammaproteobacteria bacterium]|nr:bifunctional proline dehydrogenase/L-glutamate gamma-semialdehyde dehydrogenase PutA [Gammaproteobacteria bacterium]